MQLKVIKVDGSIEEYFHTKVIGTISNALSATDQADIDITEQLAEIATYFLYHSPQKNRHTVNSNEILSIIEAILTAAGYEEAAVALNEHHFDRKLKRARIEVASIDIHELADAEMLCLPGKIQQTTRWDKSKMVQDLTLKHNINRQSARMIASMVEEKILNMGITLVPASLIKQLVWSDTAAVLQAERQLQTV